jgi:hypothetical protein
MNNAAVFAGVLGLSAILCVAVYAFGRLRIEQERTLQKLVDRGLSGEELMRAAGVVDRPTKDLRRGLLLVGVGVSWSLFTFFVGGKAWMMGIVPITLGMAFVALRVLDGGRR